MLVVHQNQDYPFTKQSIITIGSFDGIHLGHLTVLTELKSVAMKNDLKSILVTFWPHPRQIIDLDVEPPLLLNSFDEKVNRLKELNLVDILYVIPFTKELASLSYFDFVNQYFVKTLKAKFVLMGYDHRFGKNREGGYNELKALENQFGFSLIKIEAHQIDEINVSSSKIRRFLGEGDIEIANKFLGYEYPLTGTVVKGNQLGRTIGFPTANIEVDEKHKLIPQDGVYAVFVQVESKAYKGMMNIGFRPTINGQHKTLEVNILDFSEDIYGKKIVLKFVQKIRKELKFASVIDLKAQLSLDKLTVAKILNDKRII